MRDNAFYKKFKAEAQGQALDTSALKDLTLENVRTLAGADSGLSGTFLRNMKRSLTTELQQKEDDLLVSNVADSIRDRYPQAEGMMRNRVITIWLDGKPKEDDDVGI
ncbi:MAG: hypothetical protein KAR47_03790 [Planctomycetes bacterium]|nr:hypothetical protein [Planctomycetota bacterium]